MANYGVTFGDYHVTDTWGLVLKQQTMISVPEPQTYYVEVPGRNGALDISEVLTGGVAYNNRTLSFVLWGHNTLTNWTTVYSDLMAKVHGRKLKIVLDEDPEYYYEGRISVGDMTPLAPTAAQIAVTATVGPFKWENDLTEVVGKFTEKDLQPCEVDITPTNKASTTGYVTWSFGTIGLPAGMGDYESFTVRYSLDTTTSHGFHIYSGTTGAWSTTLDDSGVLTFDSTTLAKNGVDVDKVYFIRMYGVTEATLSGTTRSGFALELEGGAANSNLEVLTSDDLTGLMLNSESMTVEVGEWNDCSELTLNEGSNILLISGDATSGTVQVQYRRGWL